MRLLTNGDGCFLELLTLSSNLFLFTAWMRKERTRTFPRDFWTTFIVQHFWERFQMQTTTVWKAQEKKTAKTNSRLAISQMPRLAWSIIIEGFREFSGNIYSPSLQSNVTVCPLLRWWEPTALTLRPEEPCATETTPGSQKNLQTAASMAAPAWQPCVPTPIPPFHGFSPCKRCVLPLFNGIRTHAEETDPFILLTLLVLFCGASSTGEKSNHGTEWLPKLSADTTWTCFSESCSTNHFSSCNKVVAWERIHNCLFLMELLLLSSAEHKKLRPGKSRKSIRFHFWSTCYRCMAFSIPKHTLHARYLHFWPYYGVSGSTSGTPLPETWALSPLLLLLTHSAQPT